MLYIQMICLFSFSYDVIIDDNLKPWLIEVSNSNFSNWIYFMYNHFDNLYY